MSIKEDVVDMQPTKTVQVEVAETIRRTIYAEVPIDAIEQDDDLLYLIADIPSDNCGEPEDVDMSMVDVDDPPDYRMDVRDGKWHVTRLRYDTGSRRLLAERHSQIVRTQKESEELEFNRVTFELPDERIVPACLYYQRGHGVVVTSEKEEYVAAVLRGFDHCFPSMTEAGPIPWDAVDVLDEFVQIGTEHLLRRASEWLAELDPKEREQRQFVVPGSTITHPTPRKAVDADELYYRFQPSSDASDVTG